MNTTDTGRPMTGSPLTIDREVRPRVEEEEPMRVPVRVLRTFEGATDARGTRVRLFEPSDDVITLPEAVARMHADAGFVEVVDGEVDEDGNVTQPGDSTGEAYTVETGEDGLPTAGTPYEAVRKWLEEATGRPLLAWLAKREVSVPRGTRVPQIRERALELAAQEEERATRGREPSASEAAGVVIDEATLTVTVETDTEAPAS